MNKKVLFLGFTIGLVYLHVAYRLTVTEVSANSTTPGPAPPPPVTKPGKSIFAFGNPSLFVTTESQGFDPYRLINKFQRTFMLDEYMFFAENSQTVSARLILYNQEDTDIVTQNLGKELYWNFINSTGSLPGFSVQNTTYRATIPFKTQPDDRISFYLEYPKSFVSKETVPPYDMVFEVPAGSRTFRSTKTAVDFQSWGLLRWQLSDNPYVTWTDIKEEVEALRPKYNSSNPTDRKGNWEVEPSAFKRIDNPCLPDFFLVYLVVGNKMSKVHQIYADIPSFHFHMNEDHPNFFNLSGSFCPYYQTESQEECGFVEQIIMTNDHMVALTDIGLYVSSSLNTSERAVDSVYEEKPLISYDLIDPCAKFADYIACFKEGIVSLASELIHSIRIFYTPICSLYQYPFYEDRLIFVIEHTTAMRNDSSPISSGPPVRAVTVLYALKPYKDWNALFIGKDKYNDTDILELTGIFFNHQLRHFDITLKVRENSTSIQYRRFVLPDLLHDDENNVAGYLNINGLLGNGFLEGKFPGTFEIHSIVVSPGPMDVFFIGNQVWIAESAGPLVYPSLAGLTDGKPVRQCSFNHPDRIFVCVNSVNTRLIVGRIGSQNKVQVVSVDSIAEIWQAAGPTGAYWTQEFAEQVMKSAMYSAAFSGKILLWYLFDPVELRKSQQKLVATVGSPTDCATYCTLCSTQIELVKSCSQLKNHMDWVKDPIADDKRGPYFRMISISATSLVPLEESNAGPLTPLFIDAVTVMLYEARLPGDEAEYLYFSGVYIGQQIICPPEFNANGSQIHTGCKVYIRHVKPVDRFYEGFRQVVYGTVQTTFPLNPFPHPLRVLQTPQSNLVFLQSDGFEFQREHVGQSIIIPGHFSVLLQGFPRPDVMWGYSTVHVRTPRQPQPLHFEPFQPFLADLSTEEYRKKRIDDGADQQEWAEYNRHLDEEQQQQQQEEDGDFNNQVTIQTEYESERLGNKRKLFKMTAAETVERYNPLNAFPIVGRKKRDISKLDLKKDTFSNISDHTRVKRAPGDPPTFRWTVTDGDCHYDLKLLPNPVVFDHGGRLSLDIHDAISFVVILRPTTEVGLMLLYRPLFVITNSNPDILHVEKEVNRNIEEGVHFAKITIYPTGARMGIASLVIRSIINSLKCTSSPSMTFIVQVHRAEGRRLHVNYPIPVCQLPASEGGYPRKWKLDETNCIPYDEILSEESLEVLKKGEDTVYTRLEPNYRPPSIRGEKIPLSENVYNADPSKEKYNNWYHVSKESSKYRKCSDKVNRTECECTKADKFSDDEIFTDCKEMVYTVQRGKQIPLSIDYDPIMRPEDQHQEFFSQKDHLSVYIEEINKRTEFTIKSIEDEESDLLDMINGDEKLRTNIKGEEMTFYNGKNFTITLHGTGLFHFRAGLGVFDSFEDVTGYFVLYADTNELNHTKLIVVLLLTVTVCFFIIFLGFLRVNRRLSSQLPFLTRSKAKVKGE